MCKPSELRIAIIGAGPAGLSLAIALHRHGFKNIKVFERDHDASARFQGYSFSLFSPNGGYEFLQNLGITDEMDKIAYQPKKFRTVDGKTGKTLAEYKDKTFNSTGVYGEARRVLRAKLRNLLVEVCYREGIPIYWNYHFLSYFFNHHEMSLHFKGKPEHCTDVLIGADGINSNVRKHLVGDEITYSGYTSIMASFQCEDHKDIMEHPWIKKSGGRFTGPGKSLFFYHHPCTNVLDFHLSIRAEPGEIKKTFGKDKEKLHKYCLEQVEDFAPLAQAILKESRPCDIHEIMEFRDREPLELNKKTKRIDHVDYGPLVSCYSNPCVTLIGDAAHPMLPFSSAAGNNALLDSWHLSDALASLLFFDYVTREDITYVMSKYESEMVPRAASAVSGSRKDGEKYHKYKEVSRKLNNVGLSMMNWKFNKYYGSHKVRWAVRIASLGALGSISVLLANCYM